MFMRRVHYLKWHELMTQRANLTAQMQNHELYEFRSSARAAEIAAELQQNAAAESDSFMRVAQGIYFGVRQHLQPDIILQCKVKLASNAYNCFCSIFVHM